MSTCFVKPGESAVNETSHVSTEYFHHSNLDIHNNNVYQLTDHQTVSHFEETKNQVPSYLLNCESYTETVKEVKRNMFVPLQTPFLCTW